MKISVDISFYLQEEGVSDPMAMKQQMYAPVIQRGRGAGGGVGSPRGGGGAFGSPRGRGGWRGTGGRGRGGQGGPVGARGEPGRGGLYLGCIWNLVGFLLCRSWGYEGGEVGDSGAEVEAPDMSTYEPLQQCY